MKLSIIFISLLLIVAACSPYGNISKMEFDELNYSFPVKYVNLDDGRKIAYVDEGEGDQTIIFIHGLGSYLPAWTKNINELKNNFRCIALDLPGYGKSSKEIHSGQMEFYADIVNVFAGKLGLKKVVIAGHSMGGQIAIVASLKYPDLVDKLILVDPAGFEEFTAGQKQWFRDVMTVDGVALTNNQQIRTNIFFNFNNVPDDAEFMITDRIALKGAKDFNNYCYAVVQSVNGMVDQPVIDFLPNVNQPALIIFGKQDQLIPNRYLNPGFTEDIAKIGHSKLKNSQLKMIDNCGHFAQFEQPEEVNSAIKDFLK